MRGSANPDTVEKHDFHAPAADTAAVVTITAIATEYHVIDTIHAGFDAVADGTKKLNVTFAAVEKWAIDIPADVAVAGMHKFVFPRGLYTGTLNEEVIVTLEADGGGAAGKVNVTYR